MTEHVTTIGFDVTNLIKTLDDFKQWLSTQKLVAQADIEKLNERLTCMEEHLKSRDQAERESVDRLQKIYSSFGIDGTRFGEIIAKHMQKTDTAA